MKDSGSGRTKWLIAAVVALLLVAGGVVAVLLLPGGDDETVAGEIFLEPAAAVGEDPFSADPLATPPDEEVALAATSSAPTVSGSSAVTASSGTEPGLYGGTNDNSKCDAAAMVEFLGANAQKATAFVAALNADPDLRWAQGQLTVEAIPAYIAELTPVVLQSDIRVTNHGFVNGRANTLQSVLQKGTAVLVDKYGVPRARCYCGNPLLPPQPVQGTPRFQGAAWPDFDPAKVTTVSQPPQPANTLQLRDPRTGELFTVPVGTSCSSEPFEQITACLRAAAGQPPAPAAPTSAPAPSSTPAPTTSAPTTSAPPAPTTAAPSTAAPPPASSNQCGRGGATGTASVTVTNSTSDPVVLYERLDDCSNGQNLGFVEAGQTITVTIDDGRTLLALQQGTGAFIAERTVNGSTTWDIF